MNRKPFTRSSVVMLSHPTDRDEIKMFSRHSSVYGSSVKVRYSFYLCKQKKYGYDFFPKIMTRDRSLLLMRNLIFSDNHPRSPGDRFYNFQPLVGLLLQRFKDL